MMREHPIEGLMSAAMTSIQDMVDVNTIIGDPIETSNNIVIIPISKQNLVKSRCDPVKLLPVNHSSAIDRLLDYVPDLFEKVNEMLNKGRPKNCKEKIEDILKKEDKKQKNKKENKKESEEEITYEIEYDESQEDD